ETLDHRNTCLFKLATHDHKRATIAAHPEELATAIHLIDCEIAALARSLDLKPRNAHQMVFEPCWLALSYEFGGMEPSHERHVMCQPLRASGDALERACRL